MFNITETLETSFRCCCSLRKAQPLQGIHANHKGCQRCAFSQQHHSDSNISSALKLVLRGSDADE